MWMQKHLRMSDEWWACSLYSLCTDIKYRTTYNCLCLTNSIIVFQVPSIFLFFYALCSWCREDNKKTSYGLKKGGKRNFYWESNQQNSWYFLSSVYSLMIYINVMKNPAGYTKLFRVLNLKELGIIIKKNKLWGPNLIRQ